MPDRPLREHLGDTAPGAERSAAAPGRVRPAGAAEPRPQAGLPKGHFTTEFPPYSRGSVELGFSTKVKSQKGFLLRQVIPSDDIAMLSNMIFFI